MKLSERILDFRCERPSEFLMDDFARDAAKLEARVAELEATLERVRETSRDLREADERFLRAARKEAADAREELWKAIAKREAAADGFVMVPVEPTEEMLKAGRKQLAELTDRRAGFVYSAMLAAAQKGE